MKRGRLFSSLLILAALGPLSVSVHAGVAEVNSVAAGNGEGGFGSAIIDVGDGLLEFGSSNTIVGSTTSSPVAAFSISTLTYLSANPQLPGITDLSVGLFDPGSLFTYWISSAAPSTADSSLSVIPGLFFSSVTLPAGANWVGTGVIDTVNQLAYLGTQTSPSVIVKVQLPFLTVVASMTLPAGLDYLSASLIDPAGDFAYFASSTPTGAVAQIKLSNMSLVKTLTFNAGEGGVGCALQDPVNQIGYFGTHDRPGKIVAVGLSGLTHLNSLTLPAGVNDLTACAVDLTKGMGYFGTSTSPGMVAPILLSGLTLKGLPVTFAAGENTLRSAAIDTVNEYAYFGTYTTPGRVIQLDLLAGPPIIVKQPSDQSANPGATVTFSVVAGGRGPFTYQWQENGVNIAGATSSSYTRAVVTSDDGTPFDCIVTSSGGSVTSAVAHIIVIPTVRAYPNPWRSDRYAGVPITFDGLLPNSTIKIFNLAAHWLKTIPSSGGSVTWDLTNEEGEHVASGYYFYLVTTGNSQQTVSGKIAVIH